MSRLKTLFATLVLSAALATTASAAERLVLKPYPATPAWKEATNQAQGAKFLIEMIPSDQQIDSYRDILSAQSFPESRGVAPADLLKTVTANISGSCKNVRINGPKTGTEKGVRVAYAQIYCGQQIGADHGVNMNFKAIQGSEALYVVLRESRVPISGVGGVQLYDTDRVEQATAMLNAQGLANDYLSGSVYLCADGSKDPACAVK